MKHLLIGRHKFLTISFFAFVTILFVANFFIPQKALAAPTVDIKANGFDGFTVANAGDQVSLSWESTNAVSCNSSWSGAVATRSNGSPSPNIFINTSFIVTCLDSLGVSGSDTVIVKVPVNIFVNSVLVTGQDYLVPLGTPITFTANGGSGSYNWSTTAGGFASPTSQTGGNSFTTTFYNPQGGPCSPKTRGCVYVLVRDANDPAPVPLAAHAYTYPYAGFIPTADIKANAPGNPPSDGPITIPYNTSAIISWTSSDVTSCTITPPNWSGTSGSNSTGNLTSSVTYNLNCLGNGGASDSVTVNVQQPQAICSASTADINFTAPQGTNPGNQSWVLSNVGPAGSDLVWGAFEAVDQAWLTINGTFSGTLSGGISFPLQLSVNSASLAPGTYPFAVVAFGDNGSNPAAAGCPILVRVNLTVTAPSGGTSNLTVASTLSGSPSSGVGMTGVTTDVNGQGNGSTQFIRTYNTGANVTVTAPPSVSGNTFSSWSGCNSVTGTYICNVTMSSPKTVTANYIPAANPTLTISKTGAGAGTVTGASNPVQPNINCGGVCVLSYSPGTVVTLTATANAGSTFVGWTGDPDCGDGSVIMNVSKGCTATFNLTSAPGPYTLSVVKAGTGSGTVSTVPAGIVCGSGAGCSANFSSGTVVTLNQVPNAGSVFAGYSNNADCVDGSVTMDSSKTCTATFNASVATYTLTIIKNGTGSGTVTSAPFGINCGATCVTSFAAGTIVNLTAIASPGSAFAGYGSDPDCLEGNLTMNANKTCTASFNASALPQASCDSAPGPFNFTATQGGANPATQNWLISNNGAAGSSLVWTATDDRSWISLLPISGSLAPGTSRNIVITVNISGITAGSYTGTLTLDGSSSSPPAANCPRTATVNLTVNAPPVCPNNTPSNAFEGCVYSNLNFGGSYLGTVSEPGASGFIRDYALGGPYSETNTYSIRYRGSFNFASAGTYRFTVTHNDGARLDVDNNSSWEINNWNIVPSGTVVDTVDVNMTSGNHDLLLEFYENILTSYISISWALLPNPPAPGTPPWVNSTCERITVNWVDVTGETGYHVWRYPSVGGTTLSIGSRTYSQVATTAANVVSYTDTSPPLVGGNSYDYVVTAFNAAGESSVGPGWPTGDVANIACVPNLTASAKVIGKINGNNFVSGQTIRNGDIVTFKIIIHNAPPGTSTAYDVYVVDTISNNLQYLGNAQLDTGSGPVGIICSTAGQVVTCNSAQNLGDKPLGGNDWLLTFDTRINSSSTLPADFFENSADIRYAITNGGPRNNTVTVKTGLIPFRLGKQVPTIKEIAP